MHPKFVSLLCCPDTGQDLALKVSAFSDKGMVKTGSLERPDGKSYPIINGIPRFVTEEFYSSSFGYEWRKWPRVQFESENTGKPMQGHTTKMFKSITRFTAEDLRGKTVLEYGCGPGRFLDIVRKWGGIAVGIDLSAAVESARENFKDDENVLIVQGDLLRPPFKRGVFDHGYTIGVLHHTPRPAEGLQKLSDLVQQGGIIVCSVYQKDGFYDYPSVYIYRTCINTIKRAFGNALGNRLALWYAYCSASLLYYAIWVVRVVPFIGPPAARFLEKYFIVSLDLPDFRWRLLDIFDAITPFYASTHTFEEVRGWFENTDCRDIERTDWGPTSVRGRKG